MRVAFIRAPRKRRQAQAGVALVELALVLPFLLTLSLMAFEVGRAFYHYNTLAKSLRDAVRYLSRQASNIADPDIDPTLAKLQAARHMVVYGVPAPAGDAQPVVPGLTLDNVPLSAITWTWSDTLPRIRSVSVRVTGYSFVPVFPQAFGLSLSNANGVIPFGDIVAHMRAPE